MPTAWNNWYHCNGNTYGTWLRGDPRGFRERHHRRHIEGDYKNPPPSGSYDAVHDSSRRLMKQPPILLTPQQRVVAGTALLKKLLGDGIELLALSMDGQHFHLLGRFLDHRPRHWVGRAKMHASMVLRGWGRSGTVWARSCRALPIRDRGHQLNVYRYILKHKGQGAWTWSFREGQP